MDDLAKALGTYFCETCGEEIKDKPGNKYNESNLQHFFKQDWVINVTQKDVFYHVYEEGWFTVNAMYSETDKYHVALIRRSDNGND